jgi:hypothetical protein
MASTNFSGLQINGAELLPGIGGTVFVGNVFFVDSGTGSNGNPGTKELPFATIDYAIGMCTASNGDVIFVFPGHTETIAAAGGITADVAGISIIGLGTGNLRPTITWSGTASSFLITAANVMLCNLRTTISVDEVVSMFAVSAAGVTFDTIDFVEYGAKGVTGQAIQFLLTTAAADDLTIKNCRHKQQTAAAANQVWIDLVGTDNTRIRNNTFDILAKAATASICISGSTAVVGCEIVGNRIAWLGSTITSIINLVTTSTGIITDNRLFGGSSVVITAAITGDACYMAENYFANTAASSGALTPAIDTVT